jgi:hypothetical protein
VSYQNGDVAVHGFVSKRDPPGRVHHWHKSEGTPHRHRQNHRCERHLPPHLPEGEPIGYIVGNRPVDLDDIGPGWWSLTIDTPWGPLGFAARGASKTELASCAPPDALPSATP